MWKSKGKIHSSPGKMYKGRRKKYPKRKRTKGSHSRSRTAKKKLSQKRSKSKDSRNLSSQRSVKVDANNLQNEKYHYLYESDDALMELLPNAKPVIYEYDSFGKSLPAQTGTNHRRKKKKSRKSSSKLSRKSQKLVKDIEIVQHNIDDILQSSNLPSPSSKMTLSIHNQPQRPYQRHLSSKNSYDSIDGSLDTHLKRNKPQNDIKKVSDDIIIVNGQSFLSKKFVDEIQKKQESELKAKHKEELKKVVSSRAVSHSMDDREAESYSDSTPMLDFRQNQIYTIDDATALRELQNFENFRLRSLSQKKKNRTSKANFGKKNKKNIKFIKSEKPKQSSQSSQRTSRRGIEGSRSRSKPKIVATLNRHSKENAMLRDNEVMRDIKSKHRKSLSRKQRRLLNEDFYRKYEILTIYQSLISHLKLPKVHFGFRPKLWPNEKLKFTIEEILTQRASLQKKLYKLRYQKKEKHKFNLECLKSITSFLIDFVTDKFPKSKVTREKFILELLWSVENSKQDNLYIELFSLVLLEELDEKEFLFFLMCREHALGALRKQFPNEKIEFRVQAYYDKKFSQQDCFEIIYNLVLNYEGDEIGDFFLQEFYSLSNIASRPSIKITDFLVYMVEVYKILLDQGMQPSLVKIPKSPKSKRYTVKHYPYGNIYNNHTYKCLKRDKGDNGNVNWFLWSDYSKMDTNPEAKVSQYLKNKSQSRSQLINSATKSKIFRKSSSRGKKKNLPAPDLSRGRFDRGTSHSRSRKEIEELLRQAPKSGLSPNEMDRYFNRNFSPEAEHKRKLNPGREYGSPFSKSPSRKIYPFINHSDFQPQTINYTSQFSSGSLSPGKTFKISKSPSQYRSPDESPSPIQGPRKVQTNVLLDRGHGPTRVSYGIPKKVESESLEFSKNLPGPAHTRSKLLDSTLFKNSTNNQNQPHKSTLKDNLNKIYISGYEPHHTEASKSDNIVPGVASEKGLPNEQSSQITDIWPELRSKPKNTLMKDRIETNRSLDSQLTFSPTKHREGDSTVQYELYQSLENDSVFDKQKQTNGKDAYPMGNSPNYNLGDRKMGDLTETKGGSGDNALFAIFDNMATDNAPVQPANLEPSNFYSKGSHSFEIQPKEITPINEFDKFKKESSIFKVSGGSRNKQGRVNLRSLDGIGNDSDITHRTFSKKDYQNILDKLEPDECSRVKTLEEIDSIMHGKLPYD